MCLPNQIEEQIEDFINRLKRRQIVGSFSVAKETANILRQVVSMARWRDVNRLLNLVNVIGTRLSLAQPNELAVNNIVKRMLKVIREVSRGELGMQGSDLVSDDFDLNEEIIELENYPSLASQPSMFRLMTDISNLTVKEKEKDTYNLKSLIIQEITEEIITDLDTIYKGIADQALDFIHEKEVIMTTGQSHTVQEFLIRAAQKRKFQVIVAESAPMYQGHEMALALSKAGIDTTLITDSAIFAVMPRVNKVVLGAHAVMANGALISISGSHLLAAAAKHHSKPVLVCTALYKLSPLFTYDPDALNVTVSPQNVLSFQEGSIIDRVTVNNPYYDYIAPDHVSLFIHNLGSAPPTYIYRLINDNYDPEDS